VRDDYAAYQRLNTQVLGLSVDSVFSHEAWAQHLNLPFPLLSDFNKEVAQQYGVLLPELLGMKGLANRSAFVVDKQGVIRYTWVGANPGQQPDFGKIQDVLKGLP